MDGVRGPPWPNSKHANVDFILVGPGGVVIVDAKAWAELEIRDGSLFRGDSCEDDEVEKLSALMDSIAEGVKHTGLTSAAISAAMVFTDRKLNATLRPVTLLGDHDVVPWVAGLRQRLNDGQVAKVVRPSRRAARKCRTRSRSSVSSEVHPDRCRAFANPRPRR